MMRVWFGAWTATVAILTSFWFCAMVAADKPSSTLSIDPVDFTGIERLAIGSSRLRYGLAEVAKLPESVLSDHPTAKAEVHSSVGAARTLQLAAVNSLGETQLQELLEQAVNDGVARLLIEINDFVYAQYVAEPVVNAPYRAFAYVLLNQLKTLRSQIRHCLDFLSPKADGMPVDSATMQVHLLNGSLVTFTVGVPDGHDDGFRQYKQDKRLSKYLFRLKAPSDIAGLKRLIDTARSRGARVELVLPPMSSFELSIDGQPGFEQLVDRVELLAAELDLPVWIQDKPWSDTLFSDIFHLNTEGQREFQMQFRDWIEADE